MFDARIHETGSEGKINAQRRINGNQHENFVVRMKSTIEVWGDGQIEITICFCEIQQPTSKELCFHKVSYFSFSGAAATLFHSDGLWGVFPFCFWYTFAVCLCHFFLFQRRIRLRRRHGVSFICKKGELFDVRNSAKKRWKFILIWKLTCVR